jgi:hypothetical protein
LALVCAGFAVPQGTTASESKVYTVGNYPVEARANNAVAAKEKAIADGQQAAFRSLLKRLVPVTAYNQLERVKAIGAAELIEGFAIRSERNSSTEYIASYDFSFRPEDVRRVLDQEGLPYVEQQAEPVIVVPVYMASGGSAPGDPSEARGSDTWFYAWKVLDLGNSLTPVDLKQLPRTVPVETVRGAVEGDASGFSTIAAQFQSPRVLLAVLMPDVSGGRIRVTLAGRDAVGRFVLARNYRIEAGDVTYTSELAAVVSLGIIEGRWKAANDGSTARSAGPRIPADAMRIAVEFSSMGEWQNISRLLSMSPGVSDLEVEGLSARGARVALRYAGGPQQLALMLAERGLTLRSVGDTWVLRSR